MLREVKGLVQRTKLLLIFFRFEEERRSRRRRRMEGKGEGWKGSFARDFERRKLV